jgi:anti-sigma regulatory factor (Ser/Thr protein kinase)
MARRSVSAVLELLARTGQPFTSGTLARKAGVSRQAAHKCIAVWVRQGRLVAEGGGRGARYQTSKGRAFRFRYRREGLTEDYVGSEVREKVPFIRTLVEPARTLFDYALAEMVNNAIDHSRGRRVEVSVSRRGKRIRLDVVDDGVGLFAHVQRARKLATPLEAVGELSKGKLTTDPARHTGEGIFFTSKAVSLFEAESNGVRWVVDNARKDQAVGTASAAKGTRVRLELEPAAAIPLTKVFERFTHDLVFDTTAFRVKLFEANERFVSRSEARRLLGGLERFRKVVLDFAGVEMVGQGFADEVFRVWANAHPQVVLEAEGMSGPVAFFIERARRRV